MAHLDNWKKILVANSYIIFQVSTQNSSQLFQGDLHPLLFPEDLQCLFLEDSLHYIVIYLDCTILCVFVFSPKDHKSLESRELCLILLLQQQLVNNSAAPSIPK